MAEGGQDHNSGVADAMPTSLSSGTSGENVNLNLTNSRVNVVARNQTNVRNIAGAEEGTSPASQDERQSGRKGWWKNIRLNVGKILRRPSSASSANHQDGSATLAEGENVDQKFENCSINIVAGDLTNVYSTSSAERETRPSSHKIGCKRLIQICNDNTKEVTAVDILDDFRHEQLQQPDFEVYPQMSEVDVNDYYKGRYDNTIGYNQLAKEVGFLRQEKIEGKRIGMNDLVASMWQSTTLNSSKTVGITAIVASAGSGKSTLMRRIAGQALGISSMREDVVDLTDHGKRMVHYIELKDIEVDGKIKPSKFLFGGLFQNENEEDEAFEWLDEHQSESIIIFDGLDQARWDFAEKNLRKIKKHEKASCGIIMYNILSRTILRHVRIYIASREFKVSELPAKARPERIITLAGLTFEDAHRLFTILLNEKGEELWYKIETMSPRLLNLVSVPVFLILTAVVMGRDPTKPPPTTVTELYNRIILALQSVDNVRNRDQILSIVNKLKELAFNGMDEGRVVFKETDLKELGISADEVQDLMTKVPGNNLLSRHLMEGNFTLFFCHQSLQEYLAAIFITEMNLNEFSCFDEEHLHGERWSVVRRFVAGVVFSKSQNDIYKVSEGTEKKQVLAQSLRLQLEKKGGTEGGRRSSRIRLELYTTIYESDDDDLMKGLDVINASWISLSRDEAHVVGSLTARSQGLRYLHLNSCSIDDELLGIIARCIKDPIHVKEVDLRVNNFSATALCSFLGHRQIESLSGNLDWNVVKLTLAGGHVELKNGEDVITISNVMDVFGITDNVSGHFTIKKSALSFDRVSYVADIGFFGILFDAEFIEFDEQRQLLAKLDDLRQLSDCKLEKISKILLDCTEEQDIDWSVIETSWKKYQMEVLEIAVNGQISVEDYNRHLNRAREISAFGSIHAMFFLQEEDEFQNIVEACKQKKIEYIRCIFDVECCASVDGVSSLVNNSTLKKVTLIYRIEGDMLKGDELEKAQKNANDIDVELEVLELLREKDAWQLLDKAFYFREFHKRRQMQQR